LPPRECGWSWPTSTSTASKAPWTNSPPPAPDCLGEVVDVSDPLAVERLADRTVEHFGGVHEICNNAGVSAMGRQWELSLDD
jgi:NAD(P)-dependent dehydrogenase (short-subunit alcohol dehydrogenase family)